MTDVANRKRTITDDPPLPIGPFRDWLEHTIRRYRQDYFGDERDSIQMQKEGLFILDLHTGAPCKTAAGWGRFIRRKLREDATIRESDADLILTVIDDGTRLDDLWPEYEEALALGRRLLSPWKAS